MSLLAVPQRGRAMPGPMRAAHGAPPPLALSPRERDNLGVERRSKRLGRGAAYNWTRRKVRPIVVIAPFSAAGGCGSITSAGCGFEVFAARADVGTGGSGTANPVLQRKRAPNSETGARFHAADMHVAFEEAP